MSESSSVLVRSSLSARVWYGRAHTMIERAKTGTNQRIAGLARAVDSICRSLFRARLHSTNFSLSLGPVCTYD